MKEHSAVSLREGGRLRMTGLMDRSHVVRSRRGGCMGCQPKRSRMAIWTKGYSRSELPLSRGDPFPPLVVIFGLAPVYSSTAIQCSRSAEPARTHRAEHN